MANPVFQYTRQHFPEVYADDAVGCGLPMEPDDKWYFWDECELYDYGPYETREDAAVAMAKYVEQLLSR